MGVLRQDSEVLVVGGGTSGVVAAVAAARTGADTLLVERYGFLGGTATAGNPQHGAMDGHGNLVVRGIAHEIAQRLIAEGGANGYIRGMKWGPGAPEGIEYNFFGYDHEMLKYVLIQMCEEAGVRLLLHAFLDHAIVDGNSVTGVDVLTKSGHRQLRAKVTVDGTGDGDVAASAGAAFGMGNEEGLLQNVTMLFKVAGIDPDRALDALKSNHPNLSGWGQVHNKLKLGPRIGETVISVLGFQGRASARIAGEEDASRTIALAFTSLRKGEATLNITRTTQIDPTDADDLTRAEVSERVKAFKAVEALRQDIPGFEQCYILSTPPQVGVRESRRIVGEYNLTREDVERGRKFSDCVAKGAYPMDIHDPKGGPHFFIFTEGGESYDIPYGCLVPERVDGLLIAGRAVSCDHYALGSVRNQATVQAIGHAAGAAAALAARAGVAPRRLDVRQLRQVLREQDAMVDSPGQAPETPALAT